MDILILILGLIVLLSFLVGVVLLLGSRARAALKAKHPPPGKLVDVGGYRLHLHSQGEGSPTVVMDAGAGEFGLSWDLIQSQVARQARVCVYDRAGLGWSDPSPKPRTNEVMVAELRALLAEAGIPGPYILVGASLGGLNARLYAHLHPKEVAGLILVDATHEEQYTSEGMRQSFESILKMMPRMYGLMRLLVRTGLPALSPKRFAAMVPIGPGLSQRAREGVFALKFSNPGYFSGAQSELAAITESHARIRSKQITSLGDIPIIVIQHGKYEQMQTPELTEMNEQTNRRLQPLVAAQSTNGRLVVAEQSGHAIQLEQPEVVIQAILEMLETVRDSMHNDPAISAAELS